MASTSEPGGSTTQAGIYFQNCITVLRLAEMLCGERAPAARAGRIVAVRSEAPTEVDDTVVTWSDGRHEYIQAKLAVAPSDDAWRMLWRHFYAQYSHAEFRREPGGDLLTLAVRFAPPMDELKSALERAAHAASAAEWDQRLTGPGRALLAGVQALLGIDDPEAFFAFARCVQVWTLTFAGDPMETDSFERRTAEMLRGVIEPPATIFPVLMDLTGRTARVRGAWTREALVRDLTIRGFRAGAAAPAAGGMDFLPAPRAKGVLPVTWNIPSLSTPNLTGRTKILADMRRKLKRGKPGMVALEGVSGVGKTQLAAEYAYRHSDEYCLGWWVNSEESGALLGEYARLGAKLGLVESEGQDLRALAERVRQWLECHEGWLLVIDNALDAAELKPHLPRRHNGHIIVTSLAPSWAGNAQTLHVEKLLPDDSVKFLLKRTAQGDRAAAQELSVELDGLPLALEQAGAYCDVTGIGLAEYLKLYRSESQKELMDTRQPTTEYPRSVAATFGAIISRVQTENQAAVDLLNLCAFLAPDAIPRRLVADGAEFLPEPLQRVAKDELRFSETVAALRRYSLVSVSDAKLTIHRLVQAVARHRLDEVSQRTWTEAAVHLVDRAFPVDWGDFNSWDTCAQLISHALTAAKWAGLRPELAASVGWLLNQAGSYLIMRADYTGAKLCFEQALQVDEAVFGSDHRYVATCLNGLGIVLSHLEDPDGARACLERAVRINEGTDDRGDLALANRLFNLGSVLHEQGNLKEAREHITRALGIAASRRGRDAPFVAVCLHGLGSVLLDQGELTKALKCLRRSLDIELRTHSSAHPEVASVSNSLGCTLLRLGHYTEAITLFERAVAIAEQSLGPEHPATKLYRRNLESMAPNASLEMQASSDWQWRH